MLDHLAHKTRCCGLFATHYHQLGAEHAGDPAVATMHMACAVAEAPAASGSCAGGSSTGADACEVAEVTFLYKLAGGERLALLQPAMQLCVSAAAADVMSAWCMLCG